MIVLATPLRFEYGAGLIFRHFSARFYFAAKGSHFTDTLKSLCSAAVARALYPRLMKLRYVAQGIVRSGDLQHNLLTSGGKKMKSKIFQIFQLGLAIMFVL